MTNDEAAFQSDVREIGCIACLGSHGTRSPCEIHHILRGGRRIGEMDVLGLCVLHHRGGVSSTECVSRHPFKAQFVCRYGTEQSLLERTKVLVAIRRAGRRLTLNRVAA